jgi:simple sugar transport system permease protein
MLDVKKQLTKDINLTILTLITVVLIIGLQIMLAPKIFSARSLTSMSYQIPQFGFIALAMMLSMITGGIDLSVIANANLSGIFAAYILTGVVFGKNSGIPVGLLIVIAIIATLVISSLLGLFNGFLIAKISVPPIIATLGTMLFYGGVGMALTSGKGVVGFPDEFLKIGSGKVMKLPYIFIAFVIAAIVLAIVLSKTSFGKKVYLYGENNIATRFSAVNNEALIMKVYTVCGLLAGFASLIIISSVNSAKVGYGDTFLLQAILVSVLGGVSVTGGRGKVLGIVLGICVLQMLQSSFTLWQFTPYAKNLIWGTMLLVVMVINYVTSKRMQK